MPPDSECESCRGTGLFPVGGGDLAECGCFRRNPDGSRPKAGLQFQITVTSWVDPEELERQSLISRHSE